MGVRLSVKCTGPYLQIGAESKENAKHTLRTDLAILTIDERFGDGIVVGGKSDWPISEAHDVTCHDPMNHLSHAKCVL